MGAKLERDGWLGWRGWAASGEGLSAKLEREGWLSELVREGLAAKLEGHEGSVMEGWGVKLERDGWLSWRGMGG
jgi:hypothetical protein